MQRAATLFSCVIATTVLCAGCKHARSSTVTTITVTDQVLRANPVRLGINLDDHNFYDSAQIMKNLLFRNPGFEGMHYQSIFHCKKSTASACIDENQYAGWPADFWNGASVEVLTGGLSGRTGTVLSNTKTKAVAPDLGAQLTFAPGMDTIPVDSYISLRKDFPGDADTGWWIEKQGGAATSTELTDLPPGTQGKQALRVSATGSSIGITSYFDSTKGHNFLRFSGKYHLSFRAKKISSQASMQVALRRVDPNHVLYNQSVSLSPQWHTYDYTFTANETDPNAGTAAFSFSISNGEVLLDDVSLEEVSTTQSNPTVFRDAVVDTLQRAHPGVLRFMAAHTALGSTLNNLLAPPMARVRSGYSVWNPKQEDIPYGIDDFLLLCQTVGAEPWLTLPGALSQQEAAQLIAHLAAPHGDGRSWLQSFTKIHLEVGNEMWNSQFSGESMEDSIAYGHRVATLFGIMRKQQGYDAGRIDLEIGGQSAYGGRSKAMLDANTAADSLAIAPYMMRAVDQPVGDEGKKRLYQSLFAQPEMMVRKGTTFENSEIARSHHLDLSVYETNLTTLEGSIKQDQLSFTASQGAGIAVVDQMLLMLRDLNIGTQSLFSLTQYQFGRPDGSAVPLWGAVLDMGNTNRWRPQLLALSLANSAIEGNMLVAKIDGEDPTYSIRKGEDETTLADAHEIQAFAFGDSARRHLIVMNLSYDAPHAISLADPRMTTKSGTVRRIYSENVGDTNEDAEKVKISGPASVDLGGALTLPPHSMTVIDYVVK